MPSQRSAPLPRGWSSFARPRDLECVRCGKSIRAEVCTCNGIHAIGPCASPRVPAQSAVRRHNTASNERYEFGGPIHRVSDSEHRPLIWLTRFGQTACERNLFRNVGQCLVQKRKPDFSFNRRTFLGYYHCDRFEGPRALMQSNGFS